MQSIPDPTGHTGAAAATDDHETEIDVERAVNLLTASLRATDEPLAYRSAVMRAGYHPEPASLDTAREQLAIAASHLRDWYARKQYDYLRDGSGAVQIIDDVVADLAEIRAQLVDEVREDELDRAERVEELLYRLAEAGVITVGPAGGPPVKAPPVPVHRTVVPNRLSDSGERADVDDEPTGGTA